METEHIARMCIEQITGHVQGRAEFQPDLVFAQRNGIFPVHIVPGDRSFPAAIMLRTTVTEQEIVDGVVQDTWRLEIAPAASENVYRRLLAKRRIPGHWGMPQPAQGGDAIEAPEPSDVTVRYEMVPVLEGIHQKLSDFHPPRVGTYLEVFFAITKDGEWFITFHASSTDMLRRARGMAKKINKKEEDEWKAKHWPAESPVIFRGRRIWPPWWWQIDEPSYVEVPEVPTPDHWQQGGDLYEKIADVVAYNLAPCLESLWKSAFAQDETVAGQLIAAGYDLNSIEKTKMGLDPLREIIARARRSDHRTLFGQADDVDLVIEDPAEEEGA